MSERHLSGVPADGVPGDAGDGRERPGHAVEPAGMEDLVAAFFAAERESVDALASGMAGDDLHWQRIVRESRATTRSRRLTVALSGLGAAAAIVAAVAIGAAVLRSPAPVVADAPGTPVEIMSTTGGGPTSSAGSSSATGGEGTVELSNAVPASFHAQSVSNAGGATYVLGAADCGTTRCPALVGSGDGGRTWSVVKTFPGHTVLASTVAAPATSATSATSATATPATGDASPGPGADSPAGVVAAVVPTSTTLSKVHFADAKLGWVFGGDVRETRDGGATWHPVEHPGDVVLDLVSTADTLYLASASGCTASGCADGYQVTAVPLDAGAGGSDGSATASPSGSATPTASTSPQTSTPDTSGAATTSSTSGTAQSPTGSPTGEATSSDTPATSDTGSTSSAPSTAQRETLRGGPVAAPITGAQLTIGEDGKPLVTLTSGDAGQTTTARVDDDTLTTLEAGGGGSSAPEAVTAADGSGTVFGFAAHAGSGENAGQGNGQDDGQDDGEGKGVAVSRSDDGGRTWTVVAATGLDLAAPRLFAAAGKDDLVAASGAPNGGLLVSHDGGRTWAAPADAPTAPAGWGSVVATGDGGFDAVPRDAGSSYFRSDDGGVTWTGVQLRP